MSSSKRAAQDAAWLQHKAAIQRMIFQENRSSLETRQKLEEDGFIVTKSQLEYKLKVWGLRKRLPKNTSEEAWQYVDEHLVRRELQSKSSEVIMGGSLMAPSKVDKERRRYQRDILKRMSDTLRESLTTLLDSSDTALTRSVSSLAAGLGSMMPEAEEDEHINRAQLILQGSINEALFHHIMLLLYQFSNNMDVDNYAVDRSRGKWVVDMLASSGLIRTPLPLRHTTDPTIKAIAEKLFQCSISSLELGGGPWKPVITWLLSSGQSPNAPWTDDYMNRWTPLQYTIWHREYDVALQLLDARADPKLCYEVKKSPLLSLFQRLRPIYLETGELFIDHDEENTITNLVKRLLDAGDSLHEGPEDEGASVLMLAAGIGRLGLVDMLIQSYGANVLHRSLVDSSTLPKGFNKLLLGELSVIAMAASLCPEDEALACVKHLLRHTQSSHPSMAPADFCGPEVALVAASRGYNEVLRLLQSLGLDIAIANSKGVSPLHLSAYYGHLDACKWLLRHGAVVNPPERPGQSPSPACFAALRNHHNIVELLLQHGVDMSVGFMISECTENWDIKDWGKFDFPTSENKRERQSSTNCFVNLMGAAIIGAQDDRTYRYLARNGAKLPEWAVYYGASFPQDLGLVRFALAGNVNPNWRGPNGQTPLQAALTIGYGDSSIQRSACVMVATELLSAGATLVGGEAQQAIFLGHWGLVDNILRQSPKAICYQHNSMSILEAALLSKSNDMIQCVFAWDPHAYDSRALCAGVLFAISEGRTDILGQILRNRGPSQESLPFEGLAVGIAAWHDDTEILGMLLAGLPKTLVAAIPTRAPGWSQEYRVPTKRQLEGFFSRPILQNQPLWRDPELRLVDGSPLTLALWSKTSLATLLDHNCCPDKLTIATAAANGDLEVLKILLRLPRQNISLDCIEGPLYRAVEQGHTDILQELLTAGEDVNETNHMVSRGRSPLQKATEDGNLTMFDILIKAGAEVNGPAAKDHGATALQLAAIKGRLGLAKILIDLGADINAP
ncbi:ankyrin repeat containing protein [Colletotrichum tofieldiae]|uniref:Ankyrin repeat containing protein n=1 Tax=Colletotrichum tofieldiae TaxID=708197 RepID=A0A166XQX5_9PEZI|nr:ankyrin repeat containing protein [Colletotrichum tofieldiae]